MRPGLGSKLQIKWDTDLRKLQVLYLVDHFLFFKRSLFFFALASFVSVVALRRSRPSLNNPAKETGQLAMETY